MRKLLIISVFLILLLVLYIYELIKISMLAIIKFGFML